ncbi:MAG: hypothetical protein V7752_20925, partial [Halopseudomonas sp.]
GGVATPSPAPSGTLTRQHELWLRDSSLRRTDQAQIFPGCLEAGYLPADPIRKSERLINIECSIENPAGLSRCRDASV